MQKFVTYTAPLVEITNCAVSVLDYDSMISNKVRRPW